MWLLGIMFLLFAFAFVMGARDENRYTIWGFKIPRIIFWLCAIYCGVLGIGFLFFI